MNESEQVKGLQNRKKGTERVQTKLGKTHVDYWYSKLRKRIFSGRDGLQVQVPDWQVRLKHLGRSMWFNLKTANAAEAAVKARDIYIYLIANGWEAALEKFKPQTEKRDNLTVEEFADLLTSPWDRIHLSRLDWLKVVVSWAWQRLTDELWIIKRWNT